MFGKSFPNTLDFVLVRFILKILQTPRRRRRRGGLRRSRRFGVVVPRFSCRAEKSGRHVTRSILRAGRRLAVGSILRSPGTSPRPLCPLGRFVSRQKTVLARICRALGDN